MSVTGDRDLQVYLDQLEIGVRTATFQATSEALELIQQSVASEAPVGKTRAVQRSIGTRLFNASGAKSTVSGIVGPNVGNSPGGYAPHAHLAVLGTKQRFTSLGANRGVMPENDFVKRGFRKSQFAAASRVKEAFNRYWSKFK